MKNKEKQGKTMKKQRLLADVTDNPTVKFKKI